MSSLQVGHDSQNSCPSIIMIIIKYIHSRFPASGKANERKKGIRGRNDKGKKEKLKGGNKISGMRGGEFYHLCRISLSLSLSLSRTVWPDDTTGEDDFYENANGVTTRQGVELYGEYAFSQNF